MFRAQRPTPNVFYFDLYLNTAYAVHYVYCIFSDILLAGRQARQQTDRQQHISFQAPLFVQNHYLFSPRCKVTFNKLTLCLYDFQCNRTVLRGLETNFVLKTSLLGNTYMYIRLPKLEGRERDSRTHARRLPVKR